MDNIVGIEIKKVKGIDNLKLDVNIFPNKANILIAPNGFGKSTITKTFGGLTKTKLKLEKECFYEGYKEQADANLKIKFGDSKNYKEYEANFEKNEINNEFDSYIINNQVKADVITKKIGTSIHSSGQSKIGPIILIDKIPEKVSVKYNYALSKKEVFIVNFKYSINLANVFKDADVFTQVNKGVNYLKKIKLNGNLLKKLNEFILDIQESKHSKMETYKEYENNEMVNEIYKYADINRFFEAVEVDLNTKAERLIVLVESLYFYESNKSIWIQATKREKYNEEKKGFTELFKSFNNRSNSIGIKEKNSSLIADFPPAYKLSNGEIDALSFLCMLFIANQKLKSEKNILIIDEIFDYLDDINLFTLQYYVDKMITMYKNCNKKLYVIIMTHLDPNLFRNFNFKSMKVCYLLKNKKNLNESMINLLKKRDDLDKEEGINMSTSKKEISLFSKGFLHYSNGTYDLSEYAEKYGISKKYLKSNEFKKECYLNLRNYILGMDYDSILAIIGLRVMIEEYLYSHLNEENSKEFLEMHGTSNKIDYAEKNGVEIFDNMKSLGILYNDIAHINKNGDLSKINFITNKLDNMILCHIIMVLVINCDILKKHI